MGVKVTLPEIENINNSSGLPVLNNNLLTLGDEFDNVLYRDGSLSATGDIDMDGNKIINLGNGTDAASAATVAQLTEYLVSLNNGTFFETIEDGEANTPVDALFIVLSSSTVRWYRRTLAGSDLVYTPVTLGQLDAATENILDEINDTLNNAIAEAVASAEAAATLATAERILAEAAADAAALSAEIYPDVATGRAAVANGEYYLVIGSTTNEAVDIYIRVDASNSTLVRSYPTYAAFNNRISKSLGPPAVIVSGSNGDIARLSESKWRASVFETSDAKAKRGYRRSRRRNAARSTVYDPRGLTWLFFWDGQSNATGTSGGRLSVQTGPAESYMYMFNTGMAPATRGTPTKVNAVELTADTGQLAAWKMFHQLVLDECEIDLNDMGIEFLAGNIAQNGTGLTALNTTAYKGDTELDAALACYDTGKPLCVAADVFFHGEGDVSNTQVVYLQKLRDRYALIRASSATKTPFGTDFPFFLSQVSTHIGNGQTTPTVALAQLQSSEEDAGVFLLGPTYNIPYYDVNHYYTSEGHEWMGALAGLAMYTVLWRGEEWNPLSPTSIEQNGKFITLHFDNLDEDCNLEFDTTTVSAQTDMGFQVVTSGNAPLTISSVKLSGAKRSVLIEMSTAPAAGFKVRYGWETDEAVSGVGVFPNTGNRGQGNLRDNLGNYIKYMPDRQNFRMDRWCVIFEKGVF